MSAVAGSDPGALANPPGLERGVAGDAGAVQRRTERQLAGQTGTWPQQGAADPHPVPTGAAGAVNQAVNVTVNNTIAAPPVQFVAGKHGHGLFARFLWFVFIGWWLSALFIVAGYVFAATLILLPVGIWFLHRVPQAQTLRSRSRAFTQEFRNGVWVVTEGTRQQFPLWARALYLPVGLVLGLAWLALAWIVSLPVVTLPLSIWMIDRAPTVITLQQH